MDESEKRLRTAINALADQLCEAVDGRYDFQVVTDSEDLDIQKLTVLSNFVLESARRSIDQQNLVLAELESRVAERTRRLDLIIQGTNDGVWEWDLKANELTVSNQWLAMSGVVDQGNVMAPEVWLDRIHESDRSAFKDAMMCHANGISPRFSVEYRLADGRGGFRWMVARGICDRDPVTGEPLLMAGTQADITQKFLDPASGLPSGEYLELVLEQRLADATAEPVSLILVMFTNLARVKETLRMSEEPVLARQVCRRMINCTRPGELVVKLADGIAAILVQESERGALRQRADQILARFEDSLEVDGRELWLSTVAGALVVGQENLANVDDVLLAARTMMRELRDNVSGSFAFYQDTMRQQNRRRLETENTLRSALSYGWLESFLQPLVDLQNGEVTGFEGLCRIRHPKAGLMAPGEFIPIAEETGMIRALSDQMLAITIPMLQEPRMLARYGDQFTISVNLSPAQLHDQHLAEQILSLLNEVGAEPSRLKVELTETAVMADARIAMALMKELREAGVAVALDDFGAGYSSLGYLRSLPLDQIKIDRSLVSGADVDDEKRAILDMILTLCERLDLQVVVEGIENDLELSCLLGLGAHIGQGYLFSKPLPLDELVVKVPRVGLLQVHSLSYDI